MTSKALPPGVAPWLDSPEYSLYVPEGDEK
jgi:hypothetical protein